MKNSRAFLFLLLSSLVVGHSSFLLAADPASFTVGAFTFRRPLMFAWVPTSSTMRKAQLRFADPANPSGAGAEVTFFHFGPGQGGGVDSNLARWIGQFQEKPDEIKPAVESATVNGTKLTRVRVERGTFASGMPGGPTTPMTDFGLLGVVLESPGGDVFVKMTGPAELVKAAAGDFDALIQSAVQGKG